MEEAKVKFETIKAKEIVFGNNFLEIANKKATGEGDEERPFLSLTRGYYVEDEVSGSKDRRFIKTVTLPNTDENIKNFVSALKSVIAS
ncbi:MAG: hypothetical protein KAJ47_00190 [Candidatus Aenigmarchaeota archaeon]|nr:hypothetical protein [Candidatus Aenigmarchaeota archaeon]